MADNDNHDAQGNEGGGPADESPRGAGTRGIVQLASKRTDRDADNLEALLAETHELASETLAMVRLESYDSPVRDALVRQGSALVGSYTIIRQWLLMVRKSRDDRSKSLTDHR